MEVLIYKIEITRSMKEEIEVVAENKQDAINKAIEQHSKEGFGFSEKASIDYGVCVLESKKVDL